MRLLVAVLVFAGCTQSRTKLCGDFVCAENDVCTPDGQSCASQNAIDACNGMTEGASCGIAEIPVGACRAGVCVVAGCGNGVIDLNTLEVCDDGNRVSLDGCSADCRSLETCGDGVTDPAVLELCDCGSAVANKPLACGGVNSDAPNADCRSDCTPARCGDSIIDAPTEGCDDGDTLAGDGCRADCAGRWTRLASGTLTELVRVWADGGDDAWAISKDRILHWNGSTWTDAPGVPPTASFHAYDTICRLASGTLLMIDNEVPYRSDDAGATWSAVAPTGFIDNDSLFCQGNNAWLVGKTSASSGVLAHWTGSTFVEDGAISPANYYPNMWIGTDGVIYLWNSSALVKQVTGTSFVSLAAPGMPLALCATTSSNVTLFTDTNGAFHFDGTFWTPLAHSRELAMKNFSRCAVVGSKVLFVGQRGAILECDASQCVPSPPTDTSSDLSDVWGVDATRAFIVGSDGTILY